ncbi:MAG TPA: tRNA-intron lyase [Candidatus Thermoplasmatota archaeon]
MPGELQGERVYVRDQSEANRIYNKGGYGKPLSGGALELDLVEAAYLFSAGRLTLAKPFEGAPDFLSEAARLRPTFGVQYLAYRELREQRGDLRLAPAAMRSDGIDFRSGKEPKGQPIVVRATSERVPVPLSDLFRFAERAAKEGAQGIIAVVDEESEVTQYAVALADPQGSREHVDDQPAVDAFLLHDRLFVPASDLFDELHEREFFGKKSPGGYYLSLVEGLHLSSRGLIRVTDANAQRRLTPAELRKLAKALEPGLELRHPLFEDLKGRRLIVKTGYKFGTHFRAYQEEPRTSHAPFLVEAMPLDAVFEWPELSRAIRLSHGVRKQLLLADAGSKKVRYISVMRLR